MTAGGLSIKDRGCLRSILAEFADKIDQVALFGSRATGLARANSDIDLVVYGRLTDHDVDRLWTLFDESSISVSVDIVAYDNTLYPPLRQHIDRTRMVLFEAEQLRGGQVLIEREKVMTIRVHHLRISRSTRIIWLMEELGVPYELIQHDRDPATFRSPPSLYEVHPLGKAPAVEIDGRVMVESSAIIEYIVDRHGGGKLLPPDDGRAEYLEWLHFAEGTLGMPMLMRMLGSRLGLGELALGFMDAELKKQLDWIESQLEGKSFLCGETFTGADINLEYLLEHAVQMGLLVDRPNLTRYQAALTARPAYKKAIEIGGPVTLPRAG